MRRSFLICTIAGVPIRAHWSLFVVLPLWFLYQPLVQARYVPGGPQRLLMAFVEMTFLLAAIVLHEGAHALAARSLGGRVRDVTLWALGGITETEYVPVSAPAQVLLSLSGPAFNLLLGGAALLVSAAVGGSYLPLFAYWNLLLGAFNLIPAHPLDGSQALRAVLCARLGWGRGDLWAGRVGVLAGAAIVVFGFYASYTLCIVIGLLAIVSSYSLLKSGRSVIFPQTEAAGGEDVRSWRLPSSELKEEMRRRREARHSEEEMRNRVDEILRQISAKGIGALSEADRQFLEQASRRLQKEGR